MEKKQAVVLSGGGAYGAYEVGVIKALAAGLSPSTGYRPLEPAIYTGTSVGAYNAVFLASHWERSCAQAVDLLERVWLERICNREGGRGNGVYRWRANPFSFLDPRICLQYPLQTLSHLIEDSVSLSWDGLRRLIWFFSERQEPIPDRLAGLLDVSVFISTEPLRETLHETIDFERVLRSTKSLVIATTNWTTGELILASAKELTPEHGPHLTLGSASLPGIFPAEEYGHDLLVDGGVLMNTPLLPAIEAGADILHSIELKPTIKGIPLRTIKSTIGAMNRAQGSSWQFIATAEVRRVKIVNHMVEAFGRVKHYVETADFKPQTRELIQDTLSKTAEYVRTSMGQKEMPREVTVHRYFPTKDYNPSPLGMLLFDRSYLEEYIEEGFQEACHHDCAENGCLLPESAADLKLPEPELFSRDIRHRAAMA